MARRDDDWFDIFRALGDAFFAVLRSEWAMLQRRWGRSAKDFGVAFGLFVGSALIAAVCLVLLLVAVVLLVDAWLKKPWLSTLVVAAAGLLVAGTLAAIGHFILTKRFENPVESAKQRLTDHVTWWRERLLQEVDALPEGRDDV